MLSLNFRKNSIQKISRIGAIILLLGAHYLFAAKSSQGIQGVVTDAKSNQPLAQVNVVVLETPYGAASDPHGKFQLLNLSPGTYRIEVTMMGYQTVRQSIKVLKNKITTIDFKLVPTVLTMKSVAVIGKQERNLIKNPRLESPGLELVTSTITRREIQQQGAKTLVDALEYIPGALVETRGRKVKQFFSVRGQTYPYPDYAINGAWQREFHELPNFFPATDIERIEVIRSSSALLTGLSGLAGVINVVTREYDAPETMGEFESGSYGYYRSHLSHGAKIGTVHYATGVGFQHTDGPDAKHAAERMANFYGNLHWQPLKKLDVRFTIFHLDGKRELALAEPPASKRFQQELSMFDPFRATLSNLKLNYHINEKAAAELQVYYSKRTPVLVDEDETTHEVTRISEEDSEWGVNLIQSLALFPQNVLRLGGHYNHWVAPNGKRFYTGRRCDLATWSAVVVDEHSFGKLKVDAGLRWAKTYIDEYGAFNIDGSGKGFSKIVSVTDEWEPSLFQGNLGMGYDLPADMSLHLNLAAGEIIPRRGSLDINLVEPLSEQRVKLDFGWRWHFKTVGQISVAGFISRQQDALVLSGKIAEYKGRFIELYANRDQDQLGVELEARLAPVFNHVEGFVNFMAMRSRANLNGEMKVNKELPAMIASSGAYTYFGHFDLTMLGKYISGFESTRFVAGTITNPATPQPLGDFLAVDLTAGYAPGKSRMLRIYCEIKNLTNQKYSTVVGYPNFGRQFTLGLRQHLK